MKKYPTLEKYMCSFVHIYISQSFKAIQLYFLKKSQNKKFMLHFTQ